MCLFSKCCSRKHFFIYLLLLSFKTFFYDVEKDHLTINLHIEENDQIIHMHCPPAWGKERKMRYNHRRVTDA